LQQQSVILLHIRTNTQIELPTNLPVIHLGKPNDRVPPDIDVSGFPDAEVVSRIHADIRVEGDSYYIEDAGSSNGTYINNTPLAKGNRHRLRQGDRVSLGKGDLVSFLFKVAPLH
jgi:pSer/pThr/pTyr-binding forkhead associated (FHA) protein